MYPSVFVSESFFDLYDSEWQKWQQSLNVCSDNTNSHEVYTSLVRLKELFLHSNFITDISNSRLVNYAKMNSTGVYSNYKQLFFMKIIKDQSYQHGRRILHGVKRENISATDICYFTGNEQSFCIEEEHKRGVIFKGKDFLQDGFFLSNTFAVQPADFELSVMNSVQHPCTSLVIVDRYLFELENGESKLPLLINMINTFISNQLEVKFEIDIIVKEYCNNTLLRTIHKQILDGLHLESISLHVYSCRNNILGPDRYFLTNYGIFAVGHPWHRLGSHISCNFFPSTDILSNPKIAYELLRSTIAQVKAAINDVPANVGVCQQIWKNDELPHRIFHETEFEIHQGI
jgi:hypothetical protein